jgi:hypothetical protein
VGESHLAALTVMSVVLPAESDVIVVHRQQAGVIRDGLMPAANALIAMSAECGGAAALDGSEHFELCPS